MALFVLDEFIGASTLGSHTANTGQVWNDVNANGIVSNGLTRNSLSVPSLVAHTVGTDAPTTGKFFVAASVNLTVPAPSVGSAFINVGLQLGASVWELSIYFFSGVAYWDDPDALGYVPLAGVVNGTNLIEGELNVGELTGVFKVNGAVIRNGNIRYPGGEFPVAASLRVSMSPDLSAEYQWVSLSDTAFAPEPEAFWTQRIRCQEVP